MQLPQLSGFVTSFGHALKLHCNHARRS